ncbi:MAG: hypothetical protein OXE78_13050 [Gammaproteobacteria bacterium]|nr:hypothetical protein [Gammaproteobacteria bacterium]MCY4358466.1 hypothetical protein [Gammaproteobacteria bacterium]
MKKIIGGWLVLSLVLLVGCASSTPPGVGVWDVELNTPLGTLPATLTLNEDGSGMMGSDQLGEAPFDGATFDGNDIVFSVEVDAQGQTLMLDFTGSVQGDSVNGQFGSDFGDFSVSGTRQ